MCTLCDAKREGAATLLGGTDLPEGGAADNGALAGAHRHDHGHVHGDGDAFHIGFVPYRGDIDGVDDAYPYDILAPQVFSESDNVYSKSSLTYEGAGDQITRWNVKYDDNDVTTGAAVNGFFDDNAMGTPGVVTYGYLSDAAIAANSDVQFYADDISDHRAYSAAELAQVEYAISKLADVANLTFVRVTGADGVYVDNDSQVDMALMAENSTNGGWAVTYRNSFTGTITGSLVNIGEAGLENENSYAFLTAMHEVGHAVGLAHPGDYNGSAATTYEAQAEYFEDSRQFSMMSYWSERETGASYGGGNFANSVLLHDIAALQRLYGANTTTYTTDTVYGYNSNTGDVSWTLSGSSDHIIGAIWDAGGIDTIDMSQYTGDQVIDLREESFSSTAGMTYNIAIAKGVKVENALGGSGDDILIGNNADAGFADAQYWDYLGNILSGAPIGYSGNNLLNGGAGVDIVSYEAGAEGIAIDLTKADGVFDLGANGIDTLLGIEGLIGSAFGDELSGTNGANRLLGGLGDDTINGRGGGDWLDGGEGFDIVDLSYLDQGVTLALSDPKMMVMTQAGVTDTLSGFEGVVATAYNDEIVGEASDNVLDGRAGDDTIVGFGGADLLMGGDGNDLLIGDDAPGVYEPVQTDFGGTGGDDTLMGNDGANDMSGLGGNDSINGLGGNDTIRTGLGNDTARGGEGNDVLSSEGGLNILSGDDGNDTITGGDDADSLSGGNDDDSLTGNGGSDTLNGDGGNDTLLGSGGAITASGGAGADLITTGVSNDLVYGDGGNDTIAGGAGDDTLRGGDDDDDISSVSGANLLEGGGGRDTITGGSGADTIRGGGDSDDLYGNGGNDLIYGGDGSFDFIFGDGGNDTIFGEGGQNYIVGGSGDDSLVGGTSYDYIESGTGADILEGGDSGPTGLRYVNSSSGVTVDLGAGTASGGDAAGDSFSNFTDIYGSDGSGDSLTGDGNSNLLAGYGGNDTLAGGAGNDTLDGGAGADTLTGGSGSDIFVIHETDGATIITDFVDGEDVFDVSDVPVLSFSDLTLVQDSTDVQVSLGSTLLAVLENASVGDLDANDFLFEGAANPQEMGADLPPLPEDGALL